MIRTVSPLNSVLDRMVTLSRAMDDALGAPANGQEVRWTPSADAVETADAYLVTLDLPGVAPEGVEVTFDKNTLSVRGTRDVVLPEQARAAMRERVSGRFERALRFPTHVDGERINAEFRHGVLTITVPKSEAAKPRTITISAS